MERLFHIISYGCQMNIYDTQLIGRILSEHGYSPTEDPRAADVILVNTCSVRKHAEDRVWGRLGVLQGLKRFNPGLKLGVCGCMAQRAGTEICEKIPEVDLVVGPDNYRDIPRLLERGGCLTTQSDESYSDVFPLDGGKVSRFVAIMRGCSNFCTYCIVPYVRGTERHRPAQDILTEVRRLVRSGVKEVTLLGQSVNSYSSNGTDLASLLRRLNEVEGIERIRFTTSHPKHLSHDILDAMAQCQKVCENLHLPLQSGSTRVLRLMNRGYTKEHYLELVGRAKRTVPGISLSTDIMVGFPGEREEDFEETLEVVRCVGFDSAYMFKFSPREGTEAARLGDQIPEDERGRRLRKLIEIQNRITKGRASELVGETVELLVDGRSRRNPKELRGRTRTNRVVIFPDGDGEAELVWVRISEIRGSTPYGEGFKRVCEQT